MNESIPENTPTEPSLPLPKDRSAGLIVFGILTIVLGSLAGLFVPLMLFGQVAAARATHAPANFAVILPVTAIYGTLAVILVWLGIGSIMARRWARALLLIFSWSWLIMGLFIVAGMTFFIPATLATLSASGANGRPSMPPSAMITMVVVMALVFGVLFVILPAVWTFFYKSPHVKATCETRDPVARWTDACPLPVLGMCVWLMGSAPMMLLMPVLGHSVMPFFGMFLSGFAGTVFCLAITFIWSYAAWLLYHLDVRGWWLILIGMCVFMVSALLTYAQHDIVEMYQLMGYPEAQIEQIRKSGLLAGNRMSWVAVLSVLPFLGCLLYIKKYFRPKS